MTVIVDAAEAGVALNTWTAGTDSGMRVAMRMARPARAIRAIGVRPLSVPCGPERRLGGASATGAELLTKGVEDIGESFSGWEIA